MLTWLLEEIDSRALGLARIIVGGAALIRAIIASGVLFDLADADTLRIPYANWIPTPSLPLVVIVVVAWFLAGLAFMIGWRVAVSGPILLLAIVLALSFDEQVYSNHLYLMAWLVLLMTIADAGRGLSISGMNNPVVRWPVLLIMAQVSIVYGFSGITKINSEFLSGKVLASVLHGGLVGFPESLRTPRVLSVVAVIVVITELFLAIFLWRPNFRPAAFVLGLGLHTGITLLMAATGELLVFSLEMLALYPLFLKHAPLRVSADAGCGFCTSLVERFSRFDLLATVEFEGDLVNSDQGVRVVHEGRTVEGFLAITRVLEHLVPWLWVSPLLRLPGLRHLGERLFRRRLSGPLRTETRYS